MPYVTVSANDIIKDACEKLGVYAPGETLSAADVDRGQYVLRQTIDQWLNNSIQLWQLLPITCLCLANTQSYTLGPGGTIAGAWSPRVLLGPAEAAVVDGEGNILSAVDVVSPLEWNSTYIPPRLLADVPLAMLYDPQFPLAVVSFSPIPNAPMSIQFSAYYGFSGFADLPTTYNMTPGQGLALASNLAIAMNTYFGVGNPTPDLVTIAKQTWDTLTLTNRLSRAMSVKRNVEGQPTQPPTSQR